MFTRTEECYFQISRYRHMAKTTTNADIKRKCEQQLERWMHEAVKWERELTGVRALA
jgi:predicted transcriptional regulator